MEDACRHRYGWACYSLAIRYLEGNGVEENDFKAVLLLDDACIRLPEVCEDAAELRAQYQTMSHLTICGTLSDGLRDRLGFGKSRFKAQWDSRH